MNKLLEVTILSQAKQILDQDKELDLEVREKIIELITLTINGKVEEITSVLKDLDEQERKDYLAMTNMVLGEVVETGMQQLLEHGNERDLAFLQELIAKRDNFYGKILSKPAGQPLPVS